MPHTLPNYLEIEVADLPRAKAFYTAAFGFSITPYGDTYAAVESGPCQLGLRATPAPRPPMAVFESDDVEASLRQAEAAGATITSPITPYPGGRRFELLDPDGNRIAVYQTA